MKDRKTFIAGLAPLVALAVLSIYFSLHPAQYVSAEPIGSVTGRKGGGDFGRAMVPAKDSGCKPYTITDSTGTGTAIIFRTSGFLYSVNLPTMTSTNYLTLWNSSTTNLGPFLPRMWNNDADLDRLIEWDVPVRFSTGLAGALQAADGGVVTVCGRTDDGSND